MALPFDFQKHRREIVLGTLLLGVGVVFTYYQVGGSLPGGLGGDGDQPGSVPPGVAKMLEQISSVEVPSVMLAQLEEEKAHYDPSQRNIFHYGNVPKPGPSPEELAKIQAARAAAERARLAALREEQERQKQVQERQAALPPPPPPPQPAAPMLPTPPAITLRYSGFLGPSEAPIAVLYKGEDLILAREGETVDAQFTLLDIGFESVRIGYLDPAFQDQFQKLWMGP